MSKFGKNLVRIIIALVIVLAILVAVVIGNLDRIIKHGIETYGSEAAGVAVTVGNVDVSVRSGKGGLSGLRIANPAGFDSDYAFRLDAVELALDRGSLGSDTVVIDQLTVDAPHLVAEFQDLNKSNLGVISDNLERYAAQQPARGDEAVKLSIGQFDFRNGELRVLNQRLNLDRTISIPDFTVRDIGSAEAGVTVAEASKRMLQPVIQKALEAARSEALQRGRQQFEEQMQKAGDKIGDKVGDKVKGLLGGKDDENGN